MQRSMLPLAILIASSCLAQSDRPQAVTPYLEQATRLANDAKVKAAFSAIDDERDRILREWTAITEINAPSGQERERASSIERLLRQCRLEQIHYDGAGNLIAVRRGAGRGPTVVLDAHLDTVFQPGLKIKTQIRDGRIYAPGVGDDTRNIEALLATIRALDRANVRTLGDLIFVFTVREETDSAGVKQFLKDHSKIDYYVALDAGYGGFTYGGVGIRWSRHHIIGPGGHTRSPTPPYSATLPVARAITRIYGLDIPPNTDSNLNIGMLGGADVVNAKAADAWFTVDLRSTRNDVIAELDQKVGEILKEEAERAGMTSRSELLTETPAAQIPSFRDSRMVRMVEAVHLALGFDNPPITATASNNSSHALLAGVPAISTGAAPCSDPHALTESCEIEPFYRGIKKILLLAVALAGTPESIASTR